jgi:acyl dehydratase
VVLNESNTKTLMPTNPSSVALSIFAVPITDRYFEDYIPGSVFEFGSIRLEQDEIMDFARRFDPQFLHTDPKAAARGPFSGLIASGWHTGAAVMRLYVDHYLSHAASMASPGLDELRWTRPVRPGDSLSIRVTVMEATRSRSKPDRGLVRSFVEALNQGGEVVMTFKAMNILRSREAAGP